MVKISFFLSIGREFIIMRWLNSMYRGFLLEVTFELSRMCVYFTYKICIHIPNQKFDSSRISVPCAIETRKYHRGASVPKKIWPLPGTKYHCQRTKNRDFRQLTRLQWKNVNHIAGGVVQVHCSNSYNAKYARRATSNQFWPVNYVWGNSWNFCTHRVICFMFTDKRYNIRSAKA